MVRFLLIIHEYYISACVFVSLHFFFTDRLVEIRTVLERIRPIDHKLKYQIDKLVKAAVTGTADANDPSQFRANPDNFLNKVIKTSVYLWNGF